VAVQTITIVDANGQTQKLVVDDDGSGNYTQVLKTGFGADDTAPLLVSSTTPLPVREPVFTTVISQGGTSVTTSSTLIRSAVGGRQYITISNGGTSGIWLWFAASAAQVSQGAYLPSKSKDTYAYSGEVRAIVETGGATCVVGYVEW
jgi:hypothetical protein